MMPYRELAEKPEHIGFGQRHCARILVTGKRGDYCSNWKHQGNGWWLLTFTPYRNPLNVGIVETLILCDVCFNQFMGGGIRLDREILRRLGDGN